LFERDHEDGTLEQLLLQPSALEVLMLAKIVGQFVACILRIVLVSPLPAMTAGLSLEDMLPVLVRLCLASVSVVAIGSVAAALTIGARRGGLLQALIMLPLYTPVLIFAAGSGQGGMLFLAGIACASVPLSCWVSAALVRASVD
jgi:heme exporter protein B